ncbi:MAG: NAD(P)H-hydrate epimerase [Eubacteriales bacterium]|nr:NAD(P)H-hydrate epimerase [Eubacteriales bacterium]
MITVTSVQMKEIERRASEAGLSYYNMMENAGTGATDQIVKFESVVGKRIIVACGKGNNGGDGFVVARKLTEIGANVTLVLTEGEPKTEDAIKNYNLCRRMRITTLRISEDIGAEIEEADIIVDAIFGTGFHGELRGQTREVVAGINKSEARVYALDIPSGVNGDSGEADRDSIKADKTIVFHLPKPAHFMQRTAEFCGEVICISIGIEEVL